MQDELLRRRAGMPRASPALHLIFAHCTASKARDVDVKAAPRPSIFKLLHSAGLLPGENWLRRRPQQNNRVYELAGTVEASSLSAT